MCEGGYPLALGFGQLTPEVVPPCERRHIWHRRYHDFARGCYSGQTGKGALSASSEVDEAPLVRNGDGFRAADRVKLQQNRLDVRLRGAFGNAEAARDVLVASSLRE